MATLNDGRQSVDVSSNKTLTAADAGIVQNVIADGITITLPSTANGLNYTIRNGGAPVTSGPAGTGADASVLVTVAPQAADGFTGNGFTAAIAKKALNTKATARVGDEINIEGNGTAGATAWTFAKVIGTWAREA